jgi:Ceramidase
MTGEATRDRVYPPAVALARPSTPLGAFTGALSDQIGESDCEQIGKGALHQPVNALSSLAYVLVGLVIVVVALRRRVAPVAPSLVYAACVAAIGIGSVLFHGPQPAGSRVLHDLPIVITLLFIVVHDAMLVRARATAGPAARSSFLAIFAMSAVVVGAAGLIDDAVRTVLTALALVAVVGLEVVVFRRGMRPVRSERELLARRCFLVGVPIILALALASYVLGRTGSPVCDDDGAFQFHGLWHVLTSVIFGLWWWLALDRSGGREP